MNLTFRKNKTVVEIFSYLLIVIIGYIDYVTIPELLSSLFYLFPIYLHARFTGGGRIKSAVIAVFAGAVWIVAAFPDWRIYSTRLIFFWASFIHLGIFIAFSLLIHSLESRKNELSKKNRELQSAKNELEDAVTLLRDSNEKLEEFAHVVSHDLKNPLISIMSFINLLERKYAVPADADTKKLMTTVRNVGDRMLKMINGLLEISTLSAMGNAFSLVDSEDIIRMVIENLGHIIDENSAVVTHDPLPRVYADEIQLARVFQNLIQNAINYRAGGSVSIHVSAVDEGDSWIFSVRDNGIGIDRGHFERIFLLFQRVGGGGHGTGIGLAVCKKIVAHHGGEIWVESEPGKGSTFFFTIKKPVGRAGADESPTHQARSNPESHDLD